MNFHFQISVFISQLVSLHRAGDTLCPRMHYEWEGALLHCVSEIEVVREWAELQTQENECLQNLSVTIKRNTEFMMNVSLNGPRVAFCLLSPVAFMLHLWLSNKIKHRKCVLIVIFDEIVQPTPLNLATFSFICFESVKTKLHAP